MIECCLWKTCISVCLLHKLKGWLKQGIASNFKIEFLPAKSFPEKILWICKRTIIRFSKSRFFDVFHFKTEVRKLCRQQIQKKVQMDKINLFPLWKCFWKDAVWSYLSCKTLLRSRALRYVVSLIIKKLQLPKVGTKVVRGFSFLAELSLLAGHLLDFIFVGKVTNFARVLNFLKGSVGR